MPRPSGLDVLHHIRTQGIKTKVLVVSLLPERQYALSVVKAGARGYLPKECSANQLL